MNDVPAPGDPLYLETKKLWENELFSYLYNQGEV